MMKITTGSTVHFHPHQKSEFTTMTIMKDHREDGVWRFVLRVYCSKTCEHKLKLNKGRTFKNHETQKLMIMKPLHLLLLIIWVTITLGNFRNENPRKVIKIIKHVGSSSSYSSSSSEERSKRRHKNSRLTHSSRSRPTRTCPRDWITFERPQGRWCMKVV